jgi:hypothetical protein
VPERLATTLADRKATAMQPTVRHVQLPSGHRIARATRGVLQPSFIVVPRRVRCLARGDLLVEPVLGEVRVVSVTDFGYDNVHRQPQCQVRWVSDDGPCSAARLFPAAGVVSVRTAAPADVHAIRRGIDLAARHEREIDSFTARMIAAHLQRGPASALYAFAVSSAVSDRLYDELDEACPTRAPALARWVDALANHCLNRTDHRRCVQTRVRRRGAAL